MTRRAPRSRPIRLLSNIFLASLAPLPANRISGLTQPGIGVKPMQRTKAPFRADEVGSLLRPASIKDARAKLEKGEISADDLRKIEDMEIEKIVHKQASVGLK